jgi:hypothetical protein
MTVVLRIAMINISDDSDTAKLPPKPMGAGKYALLMGAGGAALGAITAAAFYKILPSWRDKGKSLGFQIAEWAGDMAIISGLVGYFQGKSDKEKYELRIENAYTQEQLNREKSFTKALLADRKASPQESQTRQ